MKIRRFIAPDMRRAIQLVRTEHGADAVILSSRAVEGGVEIVSALDYDQDLIAQMLPQARSAGDAIPGGEDKGVRQADRSHGDGDGDGDARTAEVSEETGVTFGKRREVSPAAAPATDVENAREGGADDRVEAAKSAVRETRAHAAAPSAVPTAAAIAAAVRAAEALEAVANQVEKPALPQAVAGSGRHDPSLAAIRNELQAMKCMLREQFAQLSWADLKKLQPERALLADRVARLDLEPTLADEIVAEVEHPESPRAWREVMYCLARRLSVPKIDPLERGGVFALVGPTGVGKTTTIAKLAARHCLRYGSESIALISTDTLRIGAQRQLDAFGAILGVPVRQAADGAELGKLLHALRDRRLVLIDTAGMAARDRRLSASLNQLEVEQKIRKYLVLSANMQAGVMDDAVRCFGAAGLSGAVLTKLDEANGLGAALSVLIRHRLKAVWLSNGQRVPEDLRLARAMHLLSWALDGDPSRRSFPNAEEGRTTFIPTNAVREAADATV